MIDITQLPWVSLENHSQLPAISAVYLAIDGNDIVQYIGRSVNLRKRWTDHYIRADLSGCDSVRIVYVEAEPELLDDLEAALIGYFEPILNASNFDVLPGTRARISFTLEKAVKDKLQTQADEESRTLSNYMNLLIKRAIEAGLVGK